MEVEKNEEAVFTAYTVYRVAMAQKKHRQVSLVDQKEEPSSSENSTPPMGLSKAAATRPTIDNNPHNFILTSSSCPACHEIPLLLVIAEVLVL